MAKSVDELLIALKFYTALYNGEMHIREHALDNFVDKEIEKIFGETEERMWKKAKAIEDVLKVKFNPSISTQADINQIEILYHMLIRKQPVCVERITTITTTYEAGTDTGNLEMDELVKAFMFIADYEKTIMGTPIKLDAAYFVKSAKVQEVTLITGDDGKLLKQVIISVDGDGSNFIQMCFLPSESLGEFGAPTSETFTKLAKAKRLSEIIDSDLVSPEG
jgi:hypothetical protein